MIATLPMVRNEAFRPPIDKQPITITEKTGLAVLTKARKNTEAFKSVVANDVISNATQLFPGITVPSLISYVKSADIETEIASHGNLNFRRDYMPGIGQFALEAQLPLNAPELVYISGYFFRSVIAERVDYLTGKGLTERGIQQRFTITTAEQQQHAAERARQSEELTTMLTHMDERLEEYTQAQFPEEQREALLVVLQRISRPTGVGYYRTEIERMSARGQTAEIKKLYLAGKLSEAYALATERKKQIFPDTT